MRLGIDEPRSGVDKKQLSALPEPKRLRDKQHPEVRYETASAVQVQRPAPPAFLHSRADLCKRSAMSSRYRFVGRIIANVAVLKKRQHSVKPSGTPFGVAPSWAAEAVRCRAALTSCQAASASEERIARRLLRSC